MTEKTALKDGLTRRRFLIGAGALATGVLAGGVAGCTGTTGSTGTAGSNTGNAGEASAIPWQYKKLDVEAVRKLGYENYYKDGCMYGVAAAIIETMRENTGGPWNTIPMDMFAYGEGGAFGWGTLCGALNGGLAMINLAAGKNADLGNDLIGWYTENPFPSDKHEAYCKFNNQITTISKSPLCHASVTRWTEAADVRVGTDERKDRCAKLTGDTAAKVAELLNKALEGQYAATFKPSAEYITCMGCHQGADSTLDNEQGKMNCVTCHEDHTKKS